MKKSVYVWRSLPRPLLVGLCLLSLATTGWTQSLVKGLVNDQDTRPLQGVSVLIKGSSIGTTTDAQGQFSLNASANQTLVFSYVGYVSQEVAVGGRTTLTVQLAPDTRNLNEVVVIGYGTQSRRSVTAAVASLKTAGLEDIPVSQTTSLLQGRVAGVDVTQGNGQPGSAINVRVRGVSSVAGTEPLYIVDGVQIKSGNFSSFTNDGFASGSGFSALADLNPNDIESIQILKDASAAAIYGSRATNGVVIITTKKGKSGKGVIGFNASTGVGQPTHLLSLLNTQQERQVIAKSFVRSGISPTLTAALLNGQSPHTDSTLYVDYQKEMLNQQAAFSDINLNFTGGNQAVTYALSGGYTNQQGSLINTGMKRYTARLNTDAVLSDWVRAGANLSFTNSRIQTQDEDGVIAPLYRALAFVYPFQKLYNPDGSFYNATTNNTVQAMREIQRYHISNRIIGRLYTDLTLSKKLGIVFKPSIATDALFFEENRFVPSTYFLNANRRQATSINNINVSLLSENLLTFSRQFGNHRVDALAGYSFQRESGRVLALTTNGGASDAVQTVNGGPTVVSYGGSQGMSTLESMFGQVNYSFNERYLLSATFRRDGSSRFGAGKRYGYFPSVSAGWRVSDEAFMQNVKFVNDLKLRASYGVTGSTQGLGNYQSQGGYSTGANYEGQAGIVISPAGMPNPNLSWETTNQSDVGLDLSLLNSRIDIVADYYVKQTKGILFNVLLPIESGFTSIADNVGEMQNQGWEFAITTRNVANANFSWETNFNISHNRNKVTSLPVAQGGFLINGGNSGNFYTILKEGYPVNSFFLLPSDGIYQTNEEAAKAPVPPLADGQGVAGDLKWIDKNKDGLINVLDREIMGTPIPAYTGGFNNSFTYKNFSLDFLFQFSLGVKRYNYMKNELMYKLSGNHLLTDILDAWSPTNPTGRWPRVKWDDFRRNGHTLQSPADIWLEDGSYTRLKAATLSYRLPVKLANRLGMSAAKIYASGTNLLTFTKYTGYDPESINLSYTASYAGVDRALPPIMRTVSLGLNVQF